MVSRTQKIFNRLDGGLARRFSADAGIAPARSGQSQGQGAGRLSIHAHEARLPFIFMNAVGLQRDVETILHEAGHAFHALATRDEDLYAYRSAPIEFCEVASMSMELLGNEFIEEFYSAADASRARRDHLEGIVGVFPWMATVDAFSTGFTRIRATRARSAPAAWLELMDRFGGDVDWSGLRDGAGAICGTGSCTFSSIRFITSNTASRSSAPCRSGPIQSATRRRR